MRKLGYAKSVIGKVGGAAMAAALMLPGTASALELTADQKRAIVAILTAPKGAPGSSIDNPSGFGANWGSVFFGVGGTHVPSDERGPDSDSWDGSASVGFGYGDSSSVVGVEVVANIISLTDNGTDSDVGDDTSWSAKIHRMVTDTSSISVGWENFGGRGAAEEATINRYVAYSGFTALADDPMQPFVFSYTIGVGTERFNRGEDSSVGVFGSVALQLTRQLAVIVDANRNGTNVGLSMVPINSVPLTVSVSAFDVNEESSENTRYGASLGYSHTF